MTETTEKAEHPKSAASSGALFDETSASRFRERWVSIQSAFVDEPRTSVKQADALVTEVMDVLTEGFARERGQLEGQWSGGEEASTEDLRQAFRRYRSFFDRLLTL